MQSAVHFYIIGPPVPPAANPVPPPIERVAQPAASPSIRKPQAGTGAKEACNVPACKCRSATCTFSRADPRTEKGVRKKQMWNKELERHFPGYKGKTSTLVVCKCHFRKEDVIYGATSRSEWHVRDNAVPDLAYAGLQFRMDAVIKERDALQTELNIIKKNMTPNQYRIYSGREVLQWDDEDIRIARRLRQRMTRETFELVTHYAPIPGLCALRYHEKHGLTAEPEDPAEPETPVSRLKTRIKKQLAKKKGKRGKKRKSQHQETGSETTGGTSSAATPAAPDSAVAPVHPAVPVASDSDIKPVILIVRGKDAATAGTGGPIGEKRDYSRRPGANFLPDGTGGGSHR